MAHHRTDTAFVERDGQLLARALARVPEIGVFVLDRDLRLMLALGGVLETLGWDPAAVIGRPAGELLPRDEWARLEPHYRAALAGETRDFRTSGSTGRGVHQVHVEPLLWKDGTVEGALATSRDITDHLSLERRAVDYRILAESAEGYTARFDVEGCWLSVSRAVEGVLGHRPDELIGRSIYDFIHPEEQERVAVTHGRMLADGGDVVTTVGRMRRRDGSWIWMEAASRSLRGEAGEVREILVASRDITARREAELALRESGERYRSVIATLNEAIFVTGVDRRVITCNPAAERLLGRPAEEIVGQSPSSVDWMALREDGSPLPLEELPGAVVLRTGRPVTGFVLGVVLPGREPIWVTANAVPLREAPGAELHGTVASFTDITEQLRAQAQVRHQALHDPLTDLPNRRHVLQRLSEALDETRTGRGPAVLFLDLDQFKVVNDSLGHAAGDRLLVALAERLRGLAEESDVVGHLGGDEFIVVRPEAGKEEAVALAQRLLAGLEEPFYLLEEPHVVRASIGILLAPRGMSPEAAVRDADTAMYRAKDRGAGRYEVFDEEARATVVRRHRTELELRAALERGELRVFYQPVCRVADGLPVAVEALARWQHPERGLLLPRQFIPVAEQTGLILRLGEWVVREACAQAAAWRDEGIRDGQLVVTVNVAARQLAQPGLARSVAEALAATSLSPRTLGLEVTEGLLSLHEAGPAEELWALTELGVRLVLDDFGTGHSSLNRLNRFAVEALKIDRGFIKGVTHDRYSRAIIEGVLSIASNLGLGFVAEGVETTDQLESLRKLGCVMAQGHLFAPALPAEDASALLRGAAAA